MKYILTSLVFVSILFFAACENSNTKETKATEQSMEKISNDVYVKKGKEIASATFATLSGNLQKAMKEGGVSNAVKYCNFAASPLVDSLETAHSASIKRTSLKLRNQNNKPTSAEESQLHAYEKMVKEGKDLKPAVKEIDKETIAVFLPIRTMPLCQKCHGKINDTMQEEDYKLIHQLYPDDKAIDYVNGDWRGMWSISFKK